MRTLTLPLMLATMIVTLSACGQHSAPVSAAGITTGELQPAAATSERSQARRLVRSVFGTGGNRLVELTTEPTRKAHVYRYHCEYWNSSMFGQSCLFNTDGTVDVATGNVEITEDRVKVCSDPPKRPPLPSAESRKVAAS